MFKTKRRIFISYRRSDSRDVVGRIYDRLIQAFGRKNVFKDIDSIPIASEFREVIVQYLANCDAVIVVIGRAWASAVNDEGRVRLHEPLDYVRIEIEQVLSHKVPVVPTLIGDATLPQESELPESIREIRRKQVTTVRHDPDFHVDMDRLIRGLKALPPRNPPLNAAAVFHPSPKSSRLPKEPPGFRNRIFPPDRFLSAGNTLDRLANRARLYLRMGVHLSICLHASSLILVQRGCLESEGEASIEEMGTGDALRYRT